MKTRNDSVKPRRAALFSLEKMSQYIAFGILFLIPAFTFIGCGGSDAAAVEELRKEVEKLRAEVRTLRSSVGRSVSRSAVKGYDTGGHSHSSELKRKPLQNEKIHNSDGRRKMYEERRKGMHDSEFREKMKDPEFRKKMRDPEFRKKMREERRNRRIGTNTVSSVAKSN